MQQLAFCLLDLQVEEATGNRTTGCIVYFCVLSHRSGHQCAKRFVIAYLLFNIPVPNWFSALISAEQLPKHSLTISHATANTHFTFITHVNTSGDDSPSANKDLMNGCMLIYD